MPGSEVLTIISSVTRVLVCASAGIEMSVARNKPAAAIEIFNGASLMFLVLLVTQRNGNSRDGASNSRPVRVLQRGRKRETHGWVTGPIGRARWDDFLEQFQRDLPRPALRVKIFRCSSDPNQWLFPCCPVSTRGADRASSRTRDGMRWTQQRQARWVFAGRFRP